MEAVFSALIGYVLGSISPAMTVSKLKNLDIRKHGSKNLGATNVTLNFGLLCGVLVMLIDISKSYAAFKLAKALFAEFELAGVLAGSFAVVGHIFPFYMKFRGGKGLAPFAGMVLAYDPFIFLCLLVLCVALVLIVNYSFIMPYSAGIIFPFWAAYTSRNVWTFLILLIVSGLLMYKHAENVKKGIARTDIKVREYIRDHIFVGDKAKDES